MTSTLSGRDALPRFPRTLSLRGAGRPAIRARAPERWAPRVLARHGMKLAGIGQAQGPAVVDMAAAMQILTQVGRIEANQAEVNAVLKKYPDRSMAAGLNDAVAVYTSVAARLRDAYVLVTRRAAGVFSGGGDDMVNLSDYEMLDELEGASGALARKAEDVVEAAGAPRESERRRAASALEVAGSAKSMGAATWGVIIALVAGAAISGLIASAG